MGIKGIYSEIGPGTRIALAKLVIETFEQKSRPLRVAIDVSIWQFQTQAGQGGTNPAIRTFYYRLLRLLSVSVQPLFVFDGPHKPKFKRNRRVGQGGAMVPNMLTKQLLKLFGFPFHMAPGEAEAECALLQKQGIVDAVLSEDVDTLMFGCGTTLRNWSSEGARGNKAPTHVSLYDAKITREGKSGLDREGMVLVALMSGGDYITEGIPGCGIKIACEAARAGFGKSLCKIQKSDDAVLAAWRSNLVHEVQTNESKYFRMRHKSLIIPEDFPNKEVLGFYTHPVVSSASKIEKLKEEIVWDGGIDVQGLRVFVEDAFEWTHKIGARKFIRGLAPALLVHKLRARADRRCSGYGDLVLTAMNEMEYVRAICGQRTHFSTDGIPEVRVIYHPNDIVGLDLDAEMDDSGDVSRDGLATHDDDQMEAEVDDELGSKRGPSQYDPTQPDKLWIPQTIAKVGVPLKLEDYEESFRDPKLFLKQKAAAKKAAGKKSNAKSGLPTGSIDRFVQVTKPVAELQSTENRRHVKETVSESELPPTYLVPALERFASPQRASSPPAPSLRRSTRSNVESTATVAATRPRRVKQKSQAPSRQAIPNANPWTLSQSQPFSSPKSISPPRITKPIYPLLKEKIPKHSQPTIVDLLSSSPQQPRHSPPQHEFFIPSSSAKCFNSPTHSYRGTDIEENVVEEEEEELHLPTLPSTVTRTRGSKRLNEGNLSLSPSSEAKELDKEHHPDQSSPSPRKRSSSNSASSISSSERRISERGDRIPSLTSPTSRLLDFGLAQHQDEEEGRLSNGSECSLPSLRSPLTPLDNTTPPRTGKQTQVIELSSSPLPGSPTSQTRCVDVFKITTNGEDGGIEKEERETRKMKKKVLLLRESIGAFQELDEEEWDLRLRAREEKVSELSRGRGRGKGREKERRALRVSQVEVLDLRDE